MASPLGGGIYIEVPFEADAGVVEVTIRNAVRSPYFSIKPFHKTSLEEWKTVERNRQAPWADFQTEKFMMQVPTSWIYKLDDPVTLMKNWDAAMDAMNDLMGLPQVRGKETMYLQVDLQNRSSVFAPGYPTVNDRYDPKKEYDGYANHYLVRGPQYAPDYVFHEQGHGYLLRQVRRRDGVDRQPAPRGRLEPEVRPYSLDEAFAASREYAEQQTPHPGQYGGHLDDQPQLRRTGSRWHAAEKAYQLKGHAKFVDIARLFGWKVARRLLVLVERGFRGGQALVEARHGHRHAQPATVAEGRRRPDAPAALLGHAAPGRHGPEGRRGGRRSCRLGQGLRRAGALQVPRAARTTRPSATSP